MPQTKKIPHHAFEFEVGEENRIVHERLYFFMPNFMKEMLRSYFLNLFISKLRGYL